MRTILAPSILAGDHSYLQKSLLEIRESGASWVHIDIMDGCFVPNISFGPQTVKSLDGSRGTLFFDVHLMLDRPDLFIDQFVNSGASLITIHIESTCDIFKTLERIRSSGVKAGIALNPETEIGAVLPYLDHVDLVLIMSVHPGFGGQSFLPEALNKLHFLQQKNYPNWIEVDGGIDEKIAKVCIEKGANVIVAGTSFFRAQDKAKFLKNIEEWKNFL